MKKFLFVGLLIVSFVFVGAGIAFAGSVLDEIMEAGVIKVSTDANWILSLPANGVNAGISPSAP
ncbi:MAG: hypothetical protein JRE58_06100 [Deltaproteobacteria bacterium]|nr:hypothetical protein [Deltaproteobacteria bacterium]